MPKNALPLAWVTLLAALLALPARPQAPDVSVQPRFTTDANLVLLDVSVTDKRGRPAIGLRKEDFAIHESGLEQKAAFFSDETRPVSWGLILDRSGSMMSMMDEVFNALLHSVEAGSVDDEIFISAFNQDVNMLQDFTSDRQRLLAAGKSLWANGSTALYDAVSLGLDHLKRGRHNKKVLVVVTDGDDNASVMRFSRLLEMVRQADATIYAIGMLEEKDSPIFRLVRAQTRGELERLAEATGGAAYFPRNIKECDRACRDIADQVSRQYTLGYYPADTNWDGRWRTIRVTLVRPGTLSVRTRSGYYARNSDRREQPGDEVAGERRQSER